MRYVRFAIYEMKPNTFDAASNKAKKDLIDNLRQQPGFVSYHLSKLDGNRSGSFSVYETRAAAENGARIIDDWVKKNMAKDVISSQMHLGELTIDTLGLGAESELHV